MSLSSKLIFLSSNPSAIAQHKTCLEVWPNQVLIFKSVAYHAHILPMADYSAIAERLIAGVEASAPFA
jgi:hypothetical protein